MQVIWKTCTKCHKVGYIASHMSTCPPCTAELENNIRDNYLNPLKVLTLEERVEILEKLVYDLMNKSNNISTY